MKGSFWERVITSSNGKCIADSTQREEVSMWLSKARKLRGLERKVLAATGILALVTSFAPLYFVGHGFAFLAILLALVGLMWSIWAIFGKDY
jgi:hypothetical protein